jgi:hypothetical protein
MECKCGGKMKVSLVEVVGILKCSLCGRGELILQSNPLEVFDYRARVAHAADENS